MRRDLVAAGVVSAVLVGVVAWALVDRAAPIAVAPAVESVVTPEEGVSETVADIEPLAETDSTRSAIIDADNASIEPTRAPATASETLVTALEFRVLSKETGAPLQGVQLLLWPDPIGERFGIHSSESSSVTFGTSPITDNLGRAKIEVPAKQAFRLTTDSEDFVESTSLNIRPLNVGEQRSIELQLATQPNDHFVLRVVDDETGAELPRSWALRGDTDVLSLESEDPRAVSMNSNWREPTVKTGVADDSGYIDMELGSWERSLVRVEAPGHAWVAFPFKEGHSTRAAAREVRLKRVAAVEVLAVDPHGSAVEGVLVEVSTEAYRMMTTSPFDSFFTTEPVRWSGTTDAQGHVLVQGLPPNIQLAMSLQSPEENVTRPPQTITLEVGEVRRIELTVGGGVPLSGWLRTPSGEGVEYTEVWLKSAGSDSFACFSSHMEDEVQTTVTSATGEFIFEDVADGAWFVGCSPNEPYAAHVERVTVSGGRADVAPTLIADSGGFILGRVIGPTGEPRQAFVHADPKESGCPASAETKADGSFSIGPLKAGIYALGAMAKRSGGEESLASSLDVEVESGASDVVLALRPGGKVSGRVVMGDTGMGVEAEIRIQPTVDDEGRMWMSFGTSSEQGEFEFEGLEPGTYTLIATTPSGQFAWRSGLSATAGAEVIGLVLALEPGARLRVRYTGSGKMGYLHVRHAGVEVVTESVERGTETTIIVPPGSIEVECEEWPERPDRLPSKSVEAIAGELTTLEFGPTKP